MYSFVLSRQKKKETGKPINERQHGDEWRTKKRKETHSHHHLPKPAEVHFQGLLLLLTWPFLYYPALARIVPSSVLSILTANKNLHISSGLSWQNILNMIWHFKSLKAVKSPEVIRKVILYNPILQIERQMQRGCAHLWNEKDVAEFFTPKILWAYEYYTD